MLKNKENEVSGKMGRDSPLCIVRVMTKDGDLIRHAYLCNAISLQSVICTSLEMGLKIECLRRM